MLESYDDETAELERRLTESGEDTGNRQHLEEPDVIKAETKALLDSALEEGNEK